MYAKYTGGSEFTELFKIFIVMEDVLQLIFPVLLFNPPYAMFEQIIC